MVGPDDIIKIISTKSNVYEILYKEGGNNIRQSFTTNNVGVIAYVSNLFELIKMDDEPHHSIEIILPNYPSLLLNIDKLSETKINTCLKLFKYALVNFLF